MNESSLTRGFERTRSLSTRVTATVSTVTLLTVGVGIGLALGRGVGVAAGEAAAEAVPGDDGVEGPAAREATDELQPATRTTMLSNTVTGRWFVPLIVWPPGTSRRSDSNRGSTGSAAECHTPVGG